MKRYWSITILRWHNSNVDYEWPLRWKQLSLGWLCFLFSCFIEFFYTCGIYLHQNGDGFSTRRSWKHWHQENVSKGQFFSFVRYALWRFNIPYWGHISCLYLYGNRFCTYRKPNLMKYEVHIMYKNRLLIC